jgi:hypothetical protein
LKRLSTETKVTTEEIEALLSDVLKRDVLDGDAAATAKRKVGRAAQKTLRKAKRDRAPESTGKET